MDFHSIRRFCLAGLVWSVALSAYDITAGEYFWTTFAGKVGEPGLVNGVGPIARFNYPDSIAVSPSGDVFVAESRNRALRKISPDGTVTTVLVAQNGLDPGPFFGPAALTFASNGTLYIADAPNRYIWEYTSDLKLKMIAGISGGPPLGIAVNRAGVLYIANNFNHTVLSIQTAPPSTPSLVAGVPGKPGHKDGAGAQAQFNSPSGMATAGDSLVYVADAENNVIRSVNAGGAVATPIGKQGPPGYMDGPVGQAQFNSPKSVAIARTGALFVADTSNHLIRQIANSFVYTIGGTARKAGSEEGFGINAGFNGPAGVAVDRDGNLFVADTQNHRIVKGLSIIPKILLLEPAGAKFLRGRSYTVRLAGSLASGVEEFGSFIPKGASAPGVIGWWNADSKGFDLISRNDAVLKPGATILTNGSRQVFQLDGKTGFLEINGARELNITNQLSVELWYRPSQSFSGNSLTLFHRGVRLTGPPPIPRASGLRLGVYGDTASAPGPVACFEFSAYFGGALKKVQSPNNTLSKDRWHHVVGVYDGAKISLYVNGKEEGSLLTGATPLQTFPASVINVGRTVGGGGFVPGFLDDLRIYNRALAAGEISELSKLKPW